MLSLYVIGCGGIGGFVIDRLPGVLSDLFLDALEKVIPKDKFDKHLSNFGNEVVPSLADRIVLIDGDEFSPRNALRQGYGSGSKLERRLYDLDKKVVRNLYLRGTHVMGVNQYLAPWNMEKVIPHYPVRNLDNTGGIMADSSGTLARMYENIYPGNRDMPVIFICVDNMKTRYEVAKYAETFDNVLLVNGGNEKTTGHVTIYERRDGEALDPNLYEVYPNITEDADLRPDEEDPCTHVAPKHDQVETTNDMIADIMVSDFSRWVREGLSTFGKNKDKRINEKLVDFDTGHMSPLFHPTRKAQKKGK